MRLIMRSESGTEYFALRPCVRESDPSPTDAVRAERGARLYDEQAMHTLRKNRALFTHDGPGGREAVFVDTEAHSVVGGAGEGFLKTVKRRLRCAFVHQSEVEKAKVFWERQRQWLSEQLGEPVTFEYRRRAERGRRPVRRQPAAVAARKSPDQAAPSDAAVNQSPSDVVPSASPAVKVGSPSVKPQLGAVGSPPSSSSASSLASAAAAGAGSMRQFPAMVVLSDTAPQVPHYSPLLQFLGIRMPTPR
eukprot:m51a1_g3974 hypothetical protein (248) ;mRNA; r:427103-428329